ncbi:MAG TPA: hypothetical protein VNH46_02270 [Gemmatimonadales bacterium]|nr:hypothetical protein [Gemmatimonadales bacterium]
MIAFRVAALVGLAGVAAGSATAQVSIGAAGLYVAFKGADFTDTDAGFGLDAQVRLPLGRMVSLGLGGQRTSHGLVGGVNSVGVLGLFAEPRVTFTTGGSARPYLMARGAYVHLSANGFDAKTNGYSVGGGAGLLVRAGPRVDVDVSVLLGAISLGDYTAAGVSQPGTSAKGGVVVLRGGLLFRLGQ